MRSAYWPDGTDDHGLFVGNAWEFVDLCMSSHDRWAWTMHTIYNHRVEVDGDGIHARGEAYNVAYLFHADERRLDTWYGRYLDEYEQRTGEWRILHRVCVHHGNTSEAVPDSMAIDPTRFRQASFDRPSSRRTIGP
jgi:hypothetical protein